MAIKYHCDRCGRQTGSLMARVRIVERLIDVNGSDQRMEYGAPGAKQGQRDFCRACADEIGTKLHAILTADFPLPSEKVEATS